MDKCAYYISERITNMGDCESEIRSAYLQAVALRHEIEKENPSICALDSISKDLHKTLLGLKYFEFQIERRKTVGECL